MKEKQKIYWGALLVNIATFCLSYSLNVPFLALSVLLLTILCLTLTQKKGFKFKIPFRDNLPIRSTPTSRSVGHSSLGQECTIDPRYLKLQALLIHIVECYDSVDELKIKLCDQASHCDLIAINTVLDAAKAGEEAKKQVTVASEVHILATGIIHLMEQIDQAYIFSRQYIDQAIHILDGANELPTVMHERVVRFMTSAQSWNEKLEENLDYVSFKSNDMILGLTNLANMNQAPEETRELCGHIFKSIEKLFQILEHVNESCEVLVRDLVGHDQLEQSRHPQSVESDREIWQSIMAKLDKKRCIDRSKETIR